MDIVFACSLFKKILINHYGLAHAMGNRLRTRHFLGPLAPGFSGHAAVRFGGGSWAEALSWVDTKASQTGVLASRRVLGTFLPFLRS